MRLLLTEYHSWSDILSDLRLNICNMVFIILIIPEHVQREIISVQFGAHKLVPFYNNFRFKKRASFSWINQVDIWMKAFREFLCNIEALDTRYRQAR